ncbi:hypothetical protein G5714_023068 [Onychostoma macrolepis]|uniref:Uncharacterized protein n=1 Tax=Onychostoma macrolepis TaxID=369639 RepID=A0A7J6BQ03_9TELE|nr:hypothetical protein G5714_023068 [Onychostoma macrolepis]
MTASASRPPNFTFLSLPVRHSEPDLPPDAGERIPASLDLPPNADERIHGQTNLPFQIPRWARPTRLTQRALSSWWTSVRASQPDKLTFFPPCSREPRSLTDAGESTPGQTTLPFQVLRLARLTRPTESWSPVGRRLEPPSQTILPFPSARTAISNPVERYILGRSNNRRGLTIRLASIDLPSDVARASRPDNLVFFPPTSAPLALQTARSPVG